MSMDYNDRQMIFGDLGGLKFPDTRLTGEEKPRKNLTQETCPYRGSNPGPLRDKRACYFFILYHLLHSALWTAAAVDSGLIKTTVVLDVNMHTLKSGHWPRVHLVSE